MNAGRDVIGAPVTEAVDQWNPRFQPNAAAIWGIDFGQFQWNVGALGGGNVNIVAGRDVLDLTAAVADSRTFAADGTTSLAFGGGNLNVNTGRNLGSALLYVANGTGRVDANGALTASLQDSRGDPIGTLLLAGDASYYVSALDNILLQGMISVTVLAPGPNSDYVIYSRFDSEFDADATESRRFHHVSKFSTNLTALSRLPRHLSKRSIGLPGCRT